MSIMLGHIYPGPEKNNLTVAETGVFQPDRIWRCRLVTALLSYWDYVEPPYGTASAA